MTVLGALLVLLACGLAGRQGARFLQQQQDWIFGAEQGLLTLMREIDYLATPLAPGLEAAEHAAGSAAPFFRQAACALRQGDGICGEEAWLQALAQTRLFWTEDAARSLAALAAGLGQSDRAGQLKQLELGRENLAVCRRQAAARVERYGKLWRSMGWMGGAVLVLFLW